MNLLDAGICFLDNILNEKPNYCFIDWFSTDVFNDINELYLDCIVKKLFEIKCNVIFLLFDRMDMNSTRINMYNNVILYAKKYNIGYIELYNNDNKQELLKDIVHTNENGSQFYGKKIYNFFINNYKDTNLNNFCIIPNENEYCNIKKLSVNKIVNNKIILTGKFKLIGIYQNIGIFSGLSKLQINNSLKYIIYRIYGVIIQEKL